MIDQGELVIFGAGGHAAVVADAAVASGFVLVGVLSRTRPDPDGRPPFGGVPWLGDPDQPEPPLAELVGRGARIHAAVGDGATRARWIGSRPEDAATVVHPSAVVSPSAELGPGTFVGPLAVVNARARLGAGVVVNSGAVIEHDVSIGAWTHVAPRAAALGGAVLGEGVLVGGGAVVLPGVEIGDRAVLGAGGVATASIPAGVTARGVPARPH